MCYISETTKVINLKPLPLDSATPKPMHWTFKQFQCIFPTQNQENVNRAKLGLVQKENFCFNWKIIIHLNIEPRDWGTFLLKSCEIYKKKNAMKLPPNS